MFRIQSRHSLVARMVAETTLNRTRSRDERRLTCFLLGSLSHCSKVVRAHRTKFYLNTYIVTGTFVKQLFRVAYGRTEMKESNRAILRMITNTSTEESNNIPGPFNDVGIVSSSHFMGSRRTRVKTVWIRCTLSYNSRDDLFGRRSRRKINTLSDLIK